MICVTCGTETAAIYVTETVTFTPSPKRPSLTTDEDVSYCRGCWAAHDAAARAEETEARMPSRPARKR
jgi:hypothetical protein